MSSKNNGSGNNFARDAAYLAFVRECIAAGDTLADILEGIQRAVLSEGVLDPALIVISSTGMAHIIEVQLVSNSDVLSARCGGLYRKYAARVGERPITGLCKICFKALGEQGRVDGEQLDAFARLARLSEAGLKQVARH